MSVRKLISFDWAMKKLLRSKANFDILEGFLSELLNENITILEVLESEANKEYLDDKFNRVDLKVKDSQKQIFIIEVQYEREFDYLQRILYGTSKTIVEHIVEGQEFAAIVKVISVNILYFDLGQGKDYVYHGVTHFQGIHEKDELQLTSKQKELFQKQKIFELFPEYYLIKVNQFDNIAKDSLDEWIYFLKNEEIKDNFKAKGLQQAKEKLDILKLSDQERQAYERYSYNRHYEASMYQSTYGSGFLDGEKKGIENGIEKGELKGEIALLERLFKEGILDEGKYKELLQPLKKKLADLGSVKN